MKLQKPWKEIAKDIKYVKTVILVIYILPNLCSLEA